MAHKYKTLYLLFVVVFNLCGVTRAETVAKATNGSTNNVASISPTTTNSSLGTSNAAAPSSNSSIVESTKLSPKVIPEATTSTTSTTTTTIATTIPTRTAVKNNTASASPKCVCDGALLSRLGENGKEIEICPECKCQYEARNTTLIKVVVIIVIWIISILVIYMLFLMCLDPLLNKRVKANYQEHTNEDDDTAVFPPLPTSNNQELNSRANVLNRVGHQQDKWKRQVREQRRHIYDRRTMLN